MFMKLLFLRYTLTGCKLSSSLEIMYMSSRICLGKTLSMGNGNPLVSALKLFILSMATHSSTLNWKSHGRRSLIGCSPWGGYELDTTERLHFHFSLSWIGEGNGNPLQCSCPEHWGACGLPSMGSQRVGHDWSDLAAAAASFFKY